MTTKMRAILWLAVFMSAGATVRAGLIVDPSDSQFAALAQSEIAAMGEGRRGPVSAELIRRFTLVTATTTIKPLTLNEETWHPNDRKGTRSHVVPLDTKMRGSFRTSPTSAIIYVHPNRVDPNMSLFKTGTLANLLARALDLNSGQFSGNHTVQEKRAAFFQNAWRDARGSVPFQVSDGVPTPEYTEAKKAGYIAPQYARNFPILNLKAVAAWTTTDISTYSVVAINSNFRPGDALYGKFRRGEMFLKVSASTPGSALLRFGSLLEGHFEIFERPFGPEDKGINLLVTELGLDFEPLIRGGTRVGEGDIDGPSGGMDLWTREIADLLIQNN